jgi:hypothetical protein
MQRLYTVQGRVHSVSVRPGPDGPRYSIDSCAVDAEVRAAPDGSVLVRLGGITYRALVRIGADQTEVCVDGHLYRLDPGAAAWTAARLRPGRASGS